MEARATGNHRTPKHWHFCAAERDRTRALVLACGSPPLSQRGVARRGVFVLVR